MKGSPYVKYTFQSEVNFMIMYTYVLDSFMRIRKNSKFLSVLVFGVITYSLKN